MQKIIVSAASIISMFGYGQKKKIETKFTNSIITIDGKMDESDWENASVAKDFIIYEPQNGTPIPEHRRTEARVLYNNDAIFIYAKMFDKEPSKIMKEISKRDNLGNADNFGIFLNGYNDGQQDFEFIVTPSNGQADAQATANNEDWSWDAIWESKAVLTDFGWAVEIKIPYAAVRFSSSKVQTWGINFWREIRRDRQVQTWSFVDKKTNNFGLQEGILTGIENIKTPSRLFLLPYTSYYVNGDKNQKTVGTLKGGMDIKYGINDAFTLDAILIPDFGQTAFDQKILNLGPFEQQFIENRAFFTEGTDLFNKGGLLYSRRIGGLPTYKLAESEEYTQDQSNISLINGFKISGRTKSGLGIGVLNTVTENAYLKIIDNNSGDIRKELEPLTNYSILVFDQRFRKNSSVSFINTNVTRNGSFRDGNVSALIYDLKTKATSFQLLGDFKFSYINAQNIKRGVKTGLEFNKISGKWISGIGGDLFTKDYDIADLGINNETNFYDFYSNVQFRILKPSNNFNNFSTRINCYTEFEKTTGKLKRNVAEIILNLITKKNHSAGGGIYISPFENSDFYEPRVAGKFLILPRKVGIWSYLSSNYSKKFAIDINPSYIKFFEESRESFKLDFGPRYRFSDKFSVNYILGIFQQNNNKGYIDNLEADQSTTNASEIIIANRNVVTYTNKLAAKFAINSKVSFNAVLQQYWSYAENKNFFCLQPDGSLKDYNGYTINKNSSYYTWNLDLSYTYWFAAGSQLSILYRNSASNFERSIDKDLGRNITNLLNNDSLSHTLSVSLKYFIDYNQAKNWLKK